MSRLNSLFESATTPGQTYQRQAPSVTRYGEDPSLNRVLSTTGYYDNFPERVSAVAELLHRTVQQARRESRSSHVVWDFATSGLGGLMTQLGQEVAVAVSGDPVIRDQSGTALSGPVEKGLVRRWVDSLKGTEGRAELLRTLRQWQATVQALADDPASDELAPVYAKYASELGSFCDQLQKRLTSGPDTVVAQPDFHNTLDIDPFEGLMEEGGEPRGFRQALNHRTPQDALTNAVTWLMQNRSGSVWTSELITLISGLEDMANTLRAGKGAHDLLVGTELRPGIATPLAAGLEDVSGAAQANLISGLTRALKQVGLWKSAPESARLGSAPRTVGTLVSGFDYQHLRDNLIYALTDEGGRAVHRSYAQVVTALEEAAKRIESGTLLVGMGGEDRASLVDALLVTAAKLARDFSGLKRAFGTARLYDRPLRGN